MNIVAAAAAAVAASETAPPAATASHPEAPHPWYLDLLIEWGGWAVMALAVLAFMKYGLPKILDGWAAMRNDFKGSLTDTTTAFTGALKDQRAHAKEERKEQRDAFEAERKLDRESVRESTKASQGQAIAMASLAVSMDSFSDELRRTTERFAPAEVDRLVLAKQAEAKKS